VKKEGAINSCFGKAVTIPENRKIFHTGRPEKGRDMTQKRTVCPQMKLCLGKTFCRARAKRRKQSTASRNWERG